MKRAAIGDRQNCRERERESESGFRERKRRVLEREIIFHGLFPSSLDGG